MSNQTPATAAGRALLDELAENPLPGARYAHDVVRRRLAAIEAEAVAAERARIAEAVRGLPSGVGRVGSRSVSVVDRAAILAILEGEKP